MGNWGDILSLVGFAVTIFVALRTKSAARRAEEAAIKTKEAILRSDVIANCSTALSIMDDLKAHHRKGHWEFCLERYGPLKRALMGIKSCSAFSEAELAIIQGAITQVADIEEKVEAALPTARWPKANTLNSILSKQSEKIHEIQTRIKQTIEVKQV